MKTNQASTLDVDYWRLWIFLALMFMGLSIVALGVQYQELFLLASGAIFDLLISFALRTTLPLKALAGAWLGMVVASAAGAGVGLILTSTVAVLGGIVEAAFIGAFLGMMVVAAALHSFGIPILPGIKLVVVPTRLVSILLPLGALIGGPLGAFFWRENVTQVFGAVGGRLMAIGSLGIVVGLVVGYRASINAGK